MVIRRIKVLYFYLTLALYICQFTTAAPLGNSANENVRNLCVTDPEASLLKYNEGQLYHYEFDTQAITRLDGLSNEENRFDVHGLAALVPETGCHYVLVVKEVSLRSGSRGGVSSTQVQELRNTFIRFGYQDGVLDEHVEVAEADTPWSVNIKRALVSLFNNAALVAGSRNATELVTNENDISGSQCSTSNTITNGGTKFQKTRDLNRCGDRDGGWSISQGVPYSLGQEFLSDTLVHSRQICEQDFAAAVLQSASCVETHNFQLLTSEASGAVATVKASIKFGNQEQGGAALVETLARDARLKLATIFFDHAETQLQSDVISKATLENALNSLCSELSSTAGSTFTSSTGGIFLDLQAAVGSASSDVLRTVYTTLGNESSDSISATTNSCGGTAGLTKRRHLFLDAAATAGSTDSIVFLLKLMQDRVDLPPGTEQLLYLNMAFADRPGESALKAANENLAWDPKNIKMLLASSGLAHQFCASRGRSQCASNEHYVILANSYGTVAQTHCSISQDVSSHSRVNYAIIALQALGNLDALTPQAVTAVYNCITDRAVSDRIKLQALQAFRRDPCQGKLKKAATNALLNTQLGSDLRIQAYLTLTRCLSSEDVRTIRHVVETEKVEQVKSFISLHRSYVLYSSKPGISQQERDMYKNVGENWASEPNFDPRKYSTYFETTNYDEDEDNGYSTDTNLVYSQNSFVPRTISSNFTVYYVGRAYNLLEVGANLADFENYFENLLGASQAGSPARPSSTNSAPGRPRFDSFDNDEYERFRDKVIMPRVQPGAGSPVSDVYIRVFGTTIFSESITAEDVVADSPSSFLRKKLRSVFGPADLNFSQQIPLLSDELKIPTVSGFPVHLLFKSTAIASLDWSNNSKGRGDWGRIVTSLASSVTIFTRGKMSFGTPAGPLNENGVKFEVKVHHSGAIEVKSEFSHGKEPGSFSYDGSIKLPSDRITFVEAANEVHWISKVDGGVGEGTLTKTAVTTTFPKVFKSEECSAKIGQYLGLQLCANAHIVEQKPGAENLGDDTPLGTWLQSFVLGSNRLSLFLEKTDIELEEFVLKVKYGKTDDSAESLTLLLDTPNSAVNRKIDVEGTFQFAGDRDGTQLSALDIRIDTPWKNIRVTEEITRKSDSETHDNFVVTYDGKEYVVTQESSWSTEKMSNSKLTAKGKLLLTYKPPNEGGGTGAGTGRFEVLRFEGTRVFNLGSERTEMGTIDEVQTTIQVEANVPLIQFNGKLSGSVVRSSIDSQMLEMELATDISDYARFYQRTNTPPLSYQFQDAALSSTWGQFSLNGTLCRSPKKLADLTLNYGRTSVEENSLSLYTESTGRVYHDFVTKLRLASTQLPLLNLDGKWTSAIDRAKEKYKLGLEFRHRPNDDDENLSFVLNAGHSRLDDGVDTTFDLQVLAPSKSIDLQAKVVVITASDKANADIDFKFGSVLVSITKLKIDKIGVSYKLKSQHVINEKTIVLESSYGGRTWKGLVHLQPENFYIDLTGTFDRKPNNYYNVDSIKVTLNTSALAPSKLLVLSYELESRDTLASLQKLSLDLKYGYDALGKFLFQKKLEGIQLEAFAYKLLETQFKAGLNPTARNEFSLTFHGEWFPTKSVVNTELMARSQKSTIATATTPPGPESVEIILKLDNGTPTYFYEVRSLTLFNGTFVDSTNDITIHGAKSTGGIKYFRRNQELRDKPSLELLFLSAAGKKYRALISTGTKTVFASDNIHLLYDIDLVVDMPKRAPIHIQYFMELQKQSLENEVQRFLLNTNYEAKYQDPKYQDSRYGLNFETKLAMQNWNPVIVLQVYTQDADHKLDLAIRQTLTELVKLTYGSTASKIGSKLYEFNFNIVHEVAARFPREMNRLVIQTRFQNHVEKTSGNADFEYKYKFVTVQAGFPVQNLEVQETGAASFARAGSSVLSFKSSKTVRLGKDEFYVKYDDLLNDKAYSLLGPNFELQATRSQSPTKVFAFLVQVSNGKVFRVDESPKEQDQVLLFGQMEVSKPDPKSTVEELSIYMSQTFSTAFYRTSSLVISHDHGGKWGHDFETSIRAMGDSKTLQVNNVLKAIELSNDLTMRVDQGDLKRLYIAYTGSLKGQHFFPLAADPNPSFEMNLQWGPGEDQNLTAVATRASVDNSFNFVFESSALAGNHWTVNMVGPDAGRGRQSFSVVAESPESNQIVKFTMEFKRNERSEMEQMTCAYEINLQGYFDGLRSGKLDAELIQSSPTRQKFSLTIEDNKNGILNTNVSLQAKCYDREHTITASACDSGDSCDSLEVFLSKIGGQEKYKFHIIGARADVKTGVSIDQANKLAEIWYPSRGRKQQHIGIKPFITQEANGSDLYYVKSEIVSAPDKIQKSGLEITLSERKIILVFVQATWENQQADADAYELGVWLDQKRKPNERIGVGLANVGASVQEVDQGRTFLLQFGHPEILKKYKKNLKISTKYRYGVGQRVFNVLVELDIFKLTEDKFTLQAELNHKVEEDGGTVFAIYLNADSKGQQLGFETNCADIKQQLDAKTADCYFQIRSREKGERKFRLKYKFEGDSRHFEVGRIGVGVGDDSQRYLYYNQSEEDSISARDPFTGDPHEFPISRTEVQLPGMVDHRVNEQTYNEDPFGYSLRTYPSSDPPGQYTEFWVGKLTADEYGIGYARVENGARRNIFQVTNPRKGRLVYTLRFAWDKATIKDVLTKLQSRVNATTGEMSRFVSSNENEIDASFDRVWSSVTSSMPDPQSVLEWDLHELKTILEEQNLPDEVTTYITSNLEGASELIFSGSNEIGTGDSDDSSLKQGLAVRIVAYGELINGVIEGLKLAIDKDDASSNIYSHDTKHAYLSTLYEKFEELSLIRENILELESRHAMLKKIVVPAKRMLLKRFQTLYKVSSDDVRDMFPYPETGQFLQSLRTYVEKRLFANENDPAIRDDFANKLHLALQRIFAETLQLDMTKGIFQFSIPEITRAKLIRKLLRANAGETAPPGIPFKFWVNLLLSREESIPPIDGKALILGTSYFQTFDRVIRRFESTCQYLLASDFVGKNFTVAIDLRLENNRATMPTRSIIFTTGQDTMVLTKDDIFFNGAQVQSHSVMGSMNLGPFIVHFKFNGDWRIIQGNMGVVVGCSLKMDVCVVRVSGIYFGKVRGVLGNFNNEGYDDFLVPTGTMTESSEAFVRAWKINAQCRTQTISKYLPNLQNYVQLAKTFPASLPREGEKL